MIERRRRLLLNDLVFTLKVAKVVCGVSEVGLVALPQNQRVEERQPAKGFGAAFP